MTSFPIQISDTVRVEKGPAVRRAKATKAILSNAKTASHYQLGALDAHGHKIEKGKQFYYVDWLADDSEHVYSVYQHDGERYQLVARYDTDTGAIDAAEKL